jgi:hypothetical protein
LLEEIELLRPTLIAFHDATAPEAIRAAYKQRGWKETPFPGDGTGHLSCLKKNSLEADALYLNLPSRGMLARQWGKVVEPAPALLRSRGRIPK